MYIFEESIRVENIWGSQFDKGDASRFFVKISMEFSIVRVIAEFWSENLGGLDIKTQKQNKKFESRELIFKSKKCCWWNARIHGRLCAY